MNALIVGLALVDSQLPNNPTEQVTYRAYNYNVDPELTFHARNSAPPDAAYRESTLSIGLALTHKELWHKSFTGEYICAAIPMCVQTPHLPGFLMVTKGPAGNRFRVTCVLVKNGKAIEALSTVGMGVMSFPSISFDSADNPIITVQWVHILRHGFRWDKCRYRWHAAKNSFYGKGQRPFDG